MNVKKRAEMKRRRIEEETAEERRDLASRSPICDLPTGRQVFDLP